MAVRPGSRLLALGLGLSWALGVAAEGDSIVVGDEQLDTWGNPGSIAGRARIAKAASRAENSTGISKSLLANSDIPPEFLEGNAHNSDNLPELLEGSAHPDANSGARPDASSGPRGSPWVVGKQAACDGKEVRYTLCRRGPCNIDNCVPQDCEVAEWSEWSDGDCTGLCVRQRGIRQPNNHCGQPCNVSLIQTVRCATNCNQEVTCPPGTDCQWDEWTEWSACTCSCGGGQKTRDRQIKVAPKGNGKKCDEKIKSQMVPCNTQPCGLEDCIDGTWGEWGAWSACSAACGGGLQWRVRQIKTEASECGLPVQGTDRDIRYCNSQGCTGDEDCRFGTWTTWGPCSCSCDGVKHRSRRIESYGKGNGEWCKGATKEVQPCNSAPLLEGDGDGCTREAEAVDCQFSEWSPWSKCSATCGYGQRTSERHVLVEAKNYGAVCTGPLKKVDRCDMQPCNDSLSVSAKPCIWGVWQEWGSCDKCGGQRKRFRLILQMPEDGGAPCEPQASEETGDCPRRCDSVYCSWGEWQSGDCSVTCGTGTVRRERHLVASASPPKDIQMYEALAAPPVAAGPTPHVSEGAFLGIAGGCLLTLLAQWSWQRTDLRQWARRFDEAWSRAGRSHSRSEEEIPLFQMQARGHGEWIPVDTADSDAS